MRPGFSKELNTACIGKVNKRLQHIRPVFLKLFYCRSADGIADPEFAFVTLNELKHFAVGRQVAFFGYLIHNVPVFIFVFVKMRVPDVEERIIPDPVRLVYLEIEAN